jgi:hypothetical protein
MVNVAAREVRAGGVRDIYHEVPGCLRADSMKRMPKYLSRIKDIALKLS